MARLTDTPSTGTASPDNLPSADRERRAAESPPGSRERSESDVSGWSPERDERPELREGRFHRAAQLRMAQPRAERDMSPYRDTRSGPYGRDDRALDAADGVGTGPLAGEHDRTPTLDPHQTPRDYRPWDRSGATRRGGDESRDMRGESSRPPEESRWREHGGSGHREGPGEEPRRSGATRAQPGSGRWHKEPLTAREIMTRQVKSVGLDSGLRDVARLMKEEDCGIVPVVDERGRLRGVLTDRDLVLRTLAEGRSPDSMVAREIMTDDVEAVMPDEDIHSLLGLMGRRQVRRVPVVERDDRLVGIISMADIANRADTDEELQRALERISSRRSFWSRLY